MATDWKWERNQKGDVAAAAVMAWRITPLPKGNILLGLNLLTHMRGIHTGERLRAQLALTPDQARDLAEGLLQLSVPGNG
jgi:hypothetical protein